MKNEKTLFIGIGNGFRQDDGAGVYIMRQLEQLLNGAGNCFFAQSSGEGTGLMELWQNYDNVILFDAIMKQGRPGRTYYFLAEKNSFPADFFHYSSHAFSLAEAVELARTLDKLPRQLMVYGVEGKDFYFGEELSHEVLAGCNKIIKEVASQYAQSTCQLPLNDAK